MVFITSTDIFKCATGKNTNLNKMLVKLSIHPSHGAWGIYPSCQRARGGIHPGQVAKLSQTTLTFTPIGNLESPVDLTH